MVYWVGGYALFAFLLTFVREIVKDIEDFEGIQRMVAILYLFISG
jgi:4-hydroxybenzoate polyprenyltransferase